MEDYGHSDYKMFLSGDARGFESIVKQYRENMILFIGQYVGDYAAAEDVSQEVFIKLCMKKPRCDERASFKTWLYTIAKHEAMNYLKKRRRMTKTEDEWSAGMENEYLDALIKDERKRALYGALGELPEAYRQVLYLKYFEELSVADIARLMKKRPQQVSDMLYNAKKSLSSLITQGGNEYEILRSGY